MPSLWSASRIMRAIRDYGIDSKTVEEVQKLCAQYDNGGCQSLSLHDVIEIVLDTGVAEDDVPPP